MTTLELIVELLEQLLSLLGSPVALLIIGVVVWLSVLGLRMANKNNWR